MLRALVVCLCTFVPLRAALADDEDPPARVGHLSVIEGNVSFKAAELGDDEWSAAVTTRPFTVGDALWVDANSRAELRIGSHVIALDQMTSVRVLALSDDVVQLALGRGRAVVQMFDLAADDTVEMDLPNAAARLHGHGVYDLFYDEADDVSHVGVRSGAADVTASNNTLPLQAGQAVRASGQDAFDMQRVSAPDAFEQWALGRTEHENDREALRYVSRDMTGYEDLDQNGSWTTTQDYGAVWYPRAVPSGWVPYRSGHWAWVAPWGWTWVDDMAWGFAPFHYGRWMSFEGRWGWCPGRIVARPVYAPALVAWVGAGSAVGWFPLGPREQYVPAYRVSPRYVERVNIMHVRVTAGAAPPVSYVNQGAAYTVVPRETVVMARPVRQATIASAPPVSAANVMTQVPLQPRRASVAAPAVNASRPPQATFARPVVTMQVPRQAPAQTFGTGSPPPPMRVVAPNGRSVIAPRPEPMTPQRSAPPPAYAAPQQHAAPAPPVQAQVQQPERSAPPAQYAPAPHPGAQPPPAHFSAPPQAPRMPAPPRQAPPPVARAPAPPPPPRQVAPPRSAAPPRAAPPHPAAPPHSR